MAEYLPEAIREAFYFVVVSFIRQLYAGRPVTPFPVQVQGIDAGMQHFGLFVGFDLDFHFFGSGLVS
jgi:hypothetical protein